MFIKYQNIKASAKRYDEAYLVETYILNCRFIMQSIASISLQEV